MLTTLGLKNFVRKFYFMLKTPKMGQLLSYRADLASMEIPSYPLWGLTIFTPPPPKKKIRGEKTQEVNL